MAWILDEVDVRGTMELQLGIEVARMEGWTSAYLEVFIRMGAVEPLVGDRQSCLVREQDYRYVHVYVDEE